MSTNTSIKVFVAVAYVLAIALSLIVGLTGGHQSQFIGLQFLSMFIPAVAVLLVNSATNEKLRSTGIACR